MTTITSNQLANQEFSALQIENRVFKSGWPGTRGYVWLVGDGRPVDPNLIIVEHEATAGIGAQSVAWKMAGNRIEVSVTMPEGDLFNPNKHQVLVTVVYRYL